MQIIICCLLDDGRTKPEPRPGREPLPAPVENMCLVKAACRSKKISTVVRCPIWNFASCHSNFCIFLLQGPWARSQKIPPDLRLLDEEQHGRPEESEKAEDEVQSHPLIGGHLDCEHLSASNGHCENKACDAAVCFSHMALFPLTKCFCSALLLLDRKSSYHFLLRYWCCPFLRMNVDQFNVCRQSFGTIPDWE